MKREVHLYQRNPKYQLNPFIARIIYLEKNGRNIDLVVSSSSTCAAKPLTGFHSTNVINFFTGKTWVCAFPELTLNDTTLRADNLAISNQLTAQNQFTRVEAAIKKYKDRGFTYITPRDYDGGRVDGHECAVDPNCPHTLRYFGDRGCLIFSPSVKDKVILDNCNMTWRFGGPACYPFSQRLRGMVVAGENDVLFESMQSVSHHYIL